MFAVAPDKETLATLPNPVASHWSVAADKPSRNQMFCRMSQHVGWTSVLEGFECNWDFPQQYFTLLQDLQFFAAQHGGSHLFHQHLQNPRCHEWGTPAYQAPVVGVELEATAMTGIVVGQFCPFSFTIRMSLHVMYLLQVSRRICCLFQTVLPCLAF